MRGRNSKQGSKVGMEIDKDEKLKQEAHLSGAYIRSLVKQLTSSRTKDSSMKTPKDPGTEVDGDHGSPPSQQNLTKFSETQQQSQPSQQPQQHKKQVRRRLHTSRPYQERLLNMAEARREIVTALKFHRASMKQANEQRQNQSQMEPTPLQPSSQPFFEQERHFKSRKNPRIYASTITTTTATATASTTTATNNLFYSAFSCPPPNSYSWPVSPVVPPPIPENLNLNLSLPNQTLGLNLNFHDFNNINSTLYQNSNFPSIYSSSSSASTSSSSALSVATEEVPSVALSHEGLPLVAEVADTVVIVDGIANGEDLGLHPAMDDDEMAEIRSIGEQHEMEWNDTLNLVTSAWWFKFLKSMEIGPEEKVEDDGYHLFDEVMEFPAWLSPNDSCLEQYLSDHSSDYYLQDPDLPW
ncbi:unnamed protein product [Ilex paraguariensis]|uniref:Hydroxyproline-rich glycoprotein family protein n=1 Tax=Ilex paraguariensis TaxID=185542 RepID=A0ABC8SBC0_9AQUA